MGSTIAGGWSLRLLGRWELLQGAEVVRVGSRQQRLLTVLGLRGPLSRGGAAGLLWPDTSETRSSGSLRTCVYEIAHRHPGVMVSTSERLALGDDVAVDVAAVRRLIDEIRANHDATGPIDAVQTLAGADLLPGWYDDWIIYAQEALAQDRLAALETLARCHLERGEADGAIRAAGSAIAIEPLRESAHLLLVRGHLLAGNYASAVRAQEHIRRLLWDELGVDLDPLFDELVTRARPSVPTTADIHAALPVRRGRVRG